MIKNKTSNLTIMVVFITSNTTKTSRQLTHQSELTQLQGHPYMLAWHKKMNSPKPECTISIHVPILL